MQTFSTEAAAINTQRTLQYAKWRNSLSPADVRAINIYRTTGKVKRRRLGLRVHDAAHPGPKRPLSSFFKFLAGYRKEVDTSKCPQGENVTRWISKSAGAKWRTLSAAEKAVSIVFRFTGSRKMADYLTGVLIDLQVSRAVGSCTSSRRVPSQVAPNDDRPQSRAVPYQTISYLIKPSS